MVFGLRSTITYDDAIQYALTVAPLAAAMLALPTIAQAQRLEPQHHPTLPIDLPALLTHFTHSNSSLKQRPYTALTYALCHADSAHLFANLRGLLLAGVHTHTYFGRRGWWLTFAGGVVAAALDPLRWREAQRRAWLDSKSCQLVPWLTPRLARVWDQHGGWLLCGASAGVSAIMGADTCLLAVRWKELLEAARADDDAHAYLPLALQTYSLLQALSFLADEHRGLVSGGVSVSAAHAGHLMGFAWGVAAFCAFALYSHRRGSAPPPPRGRGFRLGAAATAARGGGGRRLGRQ